MLPQRKRKQAGSCKSPIPENKPFGLKEKPEHPINHGSANSLDRHLDGGVAPHLARYKAWNASQRSNTRDVIRNGNGKRGVPEPA